MPSPKFSTTISLGNVIQIGALLFVCAAGWVTIKDAVSDGEIVQKDHETRIRLLETTGVRLGSEFNAMNSTLRDIKTQQMENNRLLRELLQRSPE